MHLKFRNVNDAFHGLVEDIHSGQIPTHLGASRVGEVMSIEEPVIITYSRPRERVLLNEARDANPFFHLFESLWMLAGRQDIAPLVYYSSNYAKQVQDGDDPNANGAYGYRWRQGYGGQKTQRINYGEDISRTHIDKFDHRVDQLAIIIDHLRRKPESRRVILQMWNVEDDLLKIDTSKDVCCNTSVKFRVINGVCKTCLGEGQTMDMQYSGGLHPHEARVKCPDCNGLPSDVPRYLNMTVHNRSNDLIWGSLGANVVHFSFLQEYMACALGLDVGEYHQFSDDLHTYTSRWRPDKWLNSIRIANYDISLANVSPGPMLVSDVTRFDQEVVKFIDDFDQDWKEPFLATVAKPMCEAFRHHKARQYDLAGEALDRVQAADWKAAGFAWINKREKNYNAKSKGATDTVDSDG